MSEAACIRSDWRRWRPMAWALSACICATASLAEASGPIERFVQAFTSPGQPDMLAVRVGEASHGFIVSSDGGRTFRVACSQAIAPELEGFERLNRLSLRPISPTAAIAMDGQGRLTIGVNKNVWSDDGSHCTWSSAPELQGLTIHSIETDPRDPSTAWALASSATGENANTQSRFELFRRDASGAWSPLGAVKTLTTGQLVIEADLVAFADAESRRLYVTVNIVSWGVSSRIYSLASDDDGAMWQETELPEAQRELDLIAVDPTNRGRLLAAIPTDRTDTLLLSEDDGKTFRFYAELRAIRDVTFDADGRVFVADGGDSSEERGGLYTAAALGEPLSKVGDTENVSCVHYQPETGKLFMCHLHRFGVVDPSSGAFDELVRVDTVEDLLECPGRDMFADCETQLNEGPSWCCSGHFPFTPFCSEYDVTLTPDGRRVFCGLAGQEYDQPDADDGGQDSPAASVDASSPADEEDAGSEAPADAGTPPAARKRNDGCACTPLDAPSRALGDGALAALLSCALLMRRRRATQRATS